MSSVLTMTFCGLVVASARAIPTASVVCSGYGSRLGARLEAIETKGIAVQINKVHRPVTSPEALLQRIYSSFVDAAFRSFPRTFKDSPLQEAAQKVEFESEAEQWIAGFYQEPRDAASFASNSTSLLPFSGHYGNASRIMYGSSATANKHSTRGDGNNGSGQSLSLCGRGLGDDRDGPWLPEPAAPDSYVTCRRASTLVR